MHSEYKFPGRKITIFSNLWVRPKKRRLCSFAKIDFFVKNRYFDQNYDPLIYIFDTPIRSSTMNDAFASEVHETPRMSTPPVEPEKPARIKRENSMKLAMESKVVRLQ